MIKRTFDPGFRIRLHRKDLSLAVDAAIGDSAARECSHAIGDGDMDHSGLIRTLEALAGDKL